MPAHPSTNRRPCGDFKRPQHSKNHSQCLQYFKLFPVDWDIEYRPWAMVLTIPTLRTYIERLHNHPDDYNTIIKEWQSLSKHAKQSARI